MKRLRNLDQNINTLFKHISRRPRDFTLKQKKNRRKKPTIEMWSNTFYRVDSFGILQRYFCKKVSRI